MTHNRPTSRTESTPERPAGPSASDGPTPNPPEPHTGAQPPDHITLNRSQLAALLAHHADVLAANIRSNKATGLAEHYLGMGRAAGLLDLHANALTADEETPAVAELLDAILTFPTGQPDQADAQPPAGQPALRDRIAQALADATGDRWPAQAFLTEADAVLAVLPDHAAEVRAAALNEAADAVARATGSQLDANVKLLRRLATARPDTQRAAMQYEAVIRIRTALADPDTCRPIDIDGQNIRVRGAREMTEQERGYLAQVVAAARRRHATEQGQAAAQADTEGSDR